MKDVSRDVCESCYHWSIIDVGYDDTIDDDCGTCYHDNKIVYGYETACKHFNKKHCSKSNIKHKKNNRSVKIKKMKDSYDE